MRRLLMLLAVVTVSVILLSLYLTYRLVDLSISLDHARAARQTLEEDRRILQTLTTNLAQGVKRDRLKSLVLKHYDKGYILKEEGDVLFVDGVGLRFAGDVFVGIVFMNE
jgi:hypothetical protein